MIKVVDATSVPWVDVKKVARVDPTEPYRWSPIRVKPRSPKIYTRHREEYRRPAAWQDPWGIVHLTELMECNDKSDRITLCRSFCLNPFSQSDYGFHYLDIVPCDGPVTCLACLGET